MDLVLLGLGLRSAFGSPNSLRLVCLGRIPSVDVLNMYFHSCFFWFHFSPAFDALHILNLQLQGWDMGFLGSGWENNRFFSCVDLFGGQMCTGAKPCDRRITGLSFDRYFRKRKRKPLLIKVLKLILVGLHNRHLSIKIGVLRAYPICKLWIYCNLQIELRMRKSMEDFEYYFAPDFYQWCGCSFYYRRSACQTSSAWNSQKT